MNIKIKLHEYVFAQPKFYDFRQTYSFFDR